MNTAIFLISFSGFLCTQIVLCRISVTELTCVSLSYFVGSVGFPTYRTMSAETVTAFLTWMPLISFSGLGFLYSVECEWQEQTSLSRS